MTDNKRTNVLVYSEAWGFGGIESFLMELFRRLAPKDFSFTLFTVWDWNSSYNEELAALGVDRRVVFKGHRPGQIQRLREGAAAFGRLVEDGAFDAVHVNTMNGMGLAYARVARERGVPVRVVHSHNSDVGEGSKAAKRLVHLASRSALAGEATTRLACSEAAGRHLFGGRPFEIVHNGFDVSRFAFDATAREACRRGLGVPEGSLLFGNPSRLSPAKNPLFQLEVFSEVLEREPSAHYLMQGTGELEREAKARAGELGVAENIIWVEPRPDPEVLYSAMDAMLFPSLFEGLGLVSVEAQASGLPVLASEDVPRETALTGLTSFEGLSRPAARWAEELLALARGQRDRASYAAQVRSAGYDARDAAKIVAQVYRGETAGDS